MCYRGCKASSKMLSVNDMFYNDKEEPVLVYGHPSDRSRPTIRRGYLARQDSRNFRSSASPPPSRSDHHASSWFGHRKSSQSPPRSRHHAYESQYSDYRNSKYGRSPERSSRSWFGRKNSLSPRSRYYDSQEHTKYKEDYTGYAQETGYSAELGYAEGGYRGRHGPGYVQTYASEIQGVIPRTYQTPYGASSYYPQEYSRTVKLKVPLCCEACEERITNHMLALHGVESVTCDQVKQKVTVRGTASDSDILKQGREAFKQTRFWRG